MGMQADKKIGILGANGTIGLLLQKLLLKENINAEVILGGRNLEIRKNQKKVDIFDSKSLKEFVEQVDLLINCAGPTFLMTERILKVVVPLGKDYIDAFGWIKYHIREDISSRIVLNNGCIPGALGSLVKYMISEDIEDIRVWAGGREIGGKGALSFNGRWFIKVKVNHLLYKVDNLKESVDYYRNLGFTVEYGRKEKPYNALIYFQEGPYIELINNMNMPWYLRIFLRLIGKKRFMQGMINQENESEGFIRICFECEKSELEKICSMYRKYRKNIMKIKVKRVDTKGRKLQCQTIFPEEEKIPFVRTPFENNYKIENASHPNGAKRIISVEYGINDDDQNLLHEMNSDKILKLKQGTGISHVIIETSTQKNFEFK